MSVSFLYRNSSYLLDSLQGIFKISFSQQFYEELIIIEPVLHANRLRLRVLSFVNT